MVRSSKRALSQTGKDETEMPRRRATTIATGGRLVLTDGSANLRLFVYMMGNFLHRIDRERRKLYLGDPDLALVAEIIGTAAVEPGMRDAAFRQQHKGFDSIVGVEGQRAVNASSISTAIGIPRETVRRKIKKLLKLGFIVEKAPAHYVVKPGLLQQGEWQGTFAKGMEQTVRFMNELLEQGVVQWVPDKKARQSGLR